LVDFVRGATEDPGGHLERWQREYGFFDLALTHTGSGYDQHFASDQGWAKVRGSPSATLYRRVTPKSNPARG